MIWHRCFAKQRIFALRLKRDASCDEICISSVAYAVAIEVNKFLWNELDEISLNQKTCLRAIKLLLFS